MSTTSPQLLREVLQGRGIDVPDDVAADVMITVLASLRQATERWRDLGHPGQPSVIDYAVHVKDTLDRLYGERRWAK